MWIQGMVADLVASENWHVRRGVDEAADKSTAHCTCAERCFGQNDDRVEHVQRAQTGREW